MSLSRQLLILRHAKSAWDTDAKTDFDRPLAKRGQKDAPRIGKWMCQQGLLPDLVISSPALRAKQTALAVCNKLEIKADNINYDRRIYGAGTESLLQVMADISPTINQLMLVGHNPGLDSLVEYLCGNELPYTADGKLMTTATLAQLNMPDNWSNLQAGSATLLKLTRPRELKDKK